MKNLPGRAKLAFAVVGGFVIMSMFMTLQGPAPALPTGADPASVAPRQAPATDERTARTDAEQMQRNFEEAAARASLDQSRAQVAPVQAPIAADPDQQRYAPQNSGGRREISQPVEEPVAPKPGFVTRRRTMPSHSDTPAAGSAEPAAAFSALSNDQEAPQRVVAPQTTPSGATLAPAIATARSTTLREGTVIDAVLANRLNGSAVGPVVCRVTNSIYGYDGTAVLIPAGATVLGSSEPVTQFGQNRLAVSFHRLQMPPPDGRSYDLNKFSGLSQIGDVGLRDQVNNHYLATFGAAAMIGLLNGAGQWATLGGRGENSTTVIVGDMGNQTSQTAGTVMQKFLNRPPDVTIRAGDRVKVYVTSDLELPIWRNER